VGYVNKGISGVGWQGGLSPDLSVTEPAEEVASSGRWSRMVFEDSGSLQFSKRHQNSLLVLICQVILDLSFEALCADAPGTVVVDVEALATIQAQARGTLRTLRSISGGISTRQLQNHGCRPSFIELPRINAARKSPFTRRSTRGRLLGPLTRTELPPTSLETTPTYIPFELLHVYMYNIEVSRHMAERRAAAATNRNN
jgi:hypothetical protein